MELRRPPGTGRARERYDGRFMAADGHARGRHGEGGGGEGEDGRSQRETKTSPRNLTAGKLRRAKRKSDADDEERGRAFIGFDECTVSRGINHRGRRGGGRGKNERD